MWVFAFKYEDGTQAQFAAADWALELCPSDFEKPWLAFGMPDGGIGFIKTEGLEWATITKDPA